MRVLVIGCATLALCLPAVAQEPQSKQDPEKGAAALMLQEGMSREFAAKVSLNSCFAAHQSLAQKLAEETKRADEAEAKLKPKD